MPNRDHVSSMITAILWMSLVSAVLFSKVRGQCTNADQLDSFFSAIACANMGMGSLAISKNGEVLYRRSIGYRSVNNMTRELADGQTKYRIGSITKMFTAIIIFQLIEEGKLDLQTAVNNYFPGLPNANLITIEHLLRHRTGLHNFSASKFGRIGKSREEMMAIVKSRRPESLPGVSFNYNNTNFLLLGYIIEDITGKSYATVVSERILAKINLKDVYCGNNTSLENNESYSYKFKKGWKQSPVTDMSIPGASGNIVATPSALAQFLDAVFSGKLISFTSLEQMKTMYDGYGMGMMKFPYCATEAYGHTGAIDEFVSVAAHFPNEGLSIAYCSNGQRYPVQNIITRAMDIYLGKATVISNMNLKTSKTKHVRQYVGVFRNNIFPFEITIKKRQKALQVGGMGFTNLPLEYVSKNKFRLIAANIDMEFDTDRKGLSVVLGSNNYHLIKK